MTANRPYTAIASVGYKIYVVRDFILYRKWQRKRKSFCLHAYIFYLMDFSDELHLALLQWNDMIDAFDVASCTFAGKLFSRKQRDRS